MTNRQLIVQAAYGNRFGIIPKDNDNCHGDEHLMPEISESQKRALINEIKQSLLKDPDVRADISADVYEDEKFMTLINTVSDWLDTDHESVLDMCEIGRMLVNLVNERYYKKAVEECEYE